MNSTCELWLCVDAVGDNGVGKDQEAAKVAYEADIQPLADADGFRCFQLNLTVPLPAARTLTGEVTETDDALTLTVA